MGVFVFSSMLYAADAAHMSPFSYIERGIHQVVCFVMCLKLILEANGFEAFNPANITGNKQKQNRYFVTMFLLISQLLFIIFDVVCTVFKYDEGWVVGPPCTAAIAAAASDESNWVIQHNASTQTDSCIYSENATAATTVAAGIAEECRDWIKIQAAANFRPDNLSLQQLAGVLLATSWTLQSSGMFMFLAWTNDVVTSSMKMKKGTTKLKVMAKWEYNVVSAYSLISIALYFILWWSFESGSLEQAVVPQLVGCVEWSILFFLMLLTRSRVAQLIASVNDPDVLVILERLHSMMLYSSITLFMEALGMSFIDWDIYTWHAGFHPGRMGADADGNPTSVDSHRVDLMLVYNLYKPLFQDFCISFYSTGFAFIPLPIVMMMYPPKSAAEIRKAAELRLSKKKTGSVSPSGGASGGGTDVPATVMDVPTTMSGAYTQDDNALATKMVN